VIGVFTRTALASSNGDARRSLGQRSFYANGEQLDENSLLSDVKLVHGRYLLLRKGKKSHHLVEISS
jgi:tyrosyl-tRNA synthetase